MKIEKSENWILFGASRGLGLEFLKGCQSVESTIQLTVVSRQFQSLSTLKTEALRNSSVQFIPCDLSKPTQLNDLLSSLQSEPVTRVIYFAGGGPHGEFQQKNWKDHEWAFQVSFLSAAQVLFHFMKQHSTQQIVFIGSQIAESQPDPKAASYAAAKHALKGLVESVQGESPSLDLRLFSPGYMDTTLLPKTAWPRQTTGLIAKPADVAAELLSWMQDSKFRCQNWSKSIV